MGPETPALDATDTVTLRDRLRAKLDDRSARRDADIEIEIESEGVRVSRLRREIEFGDDRTFLDDC